MRCEICGREIERSMFKSAILCSDACFDKRFWKRIIAEKDKHIIIRGDCYRDGGNIDNPDPYRFMGYSGRRFWIRFFDGSTLTTNNLWYQGIIPDEFRSELPDTAEFYWPKEHEHIGYF